MNESEISNISPFSNGYSFIETENAVYQIDLNGNIINKYDISDNIKAKAYDGGQIWIEEYNSNLTVQDMYINYMMKVEMKLQNFP